eukprot:m.1581549 g.1581549  ORF g.1581549 m.1581549 type:complete len:77 (+) comp25317_c0_seq12:1819-2049(+)
MHASGGPAGTIWHNAPTNALRMQTTIPPHTPGVCADRISPCLQAAVTSGSLHAAEVRPGPWVGREVRGRAAACVGG